MAFRSNGPITLSLPAFRGVTRQIILLAVGAFFGSILFSLIAPQTAVTVIGHLLLRPTDAFHGMVWQFLTYPFLANGLIGLLIACLSLWFFGSALEDERGSRWLIEYLLSATVGGGLLASLLAYLNAGRVAGLGPTSITGSLWPAVLALLLAFARFHAEEELVFSFVLRLKAKYLAAIYLLFYLGSALIGGDRFGALTALCNALAAYAFLQLAPRSGLNRAVSEQWFGLQNRWARARRQRAARKFTVYMRKQGKDVNIDPEGRYVDPDRKPRDPRDPNDRSWMN